MDPDGTGRRENTEGERRDGDGAEGRGGGDGTQAPKKKCDMKDQGGGCRESFLLSLRVGSRC